MWQFSETVDGVSEACRDLDVPVVGGNVSFYNTTDDQDIHPTPVVGMLGLADPMPDRPPRLDAARPGDDVWLIGPSGRNLAGSLYQKVWEGEIGGRPSAPDPDTGRAAMAAAAEMALSGLAHALHDVSTGGVAVALAEIAIRSQIGVTMEGAVWQELFSEDPHRFVAAVAPRHRPAVEELVSRLGIDAIRAGGFGGDRISLRNFDGAGLQLEEAERLWRGAIRERMTG